MFPESDPGSVSDLMLFLIQLLQSLLIVTSI